MFQQQRLRATVFAGLVGVALGAWSTGVSAGQGAAAPAPAAPPAPSPKAMAPLDLTGYWVSVVTEDWRWRMMTPAKGDYASVPLNPDGRKTADQWDQARDESTGQACRAFGVGGLMRMPRL